MVDLRPENQAPKISRISSDLLLTSLPIHGLLVYVTNLHSLSSDQLNHAYGVLTTMFGIVSINVSGVEITLDRLKAYHQDNPGRFGSHKACSICQAEEDDNYLD